MKVLDSVGKTKCNMDDKIGIVLKNDLRVRTGFSGVVTYSADG